MADIFISYAREDREAVEALAVRLEAAGLTCWWDRQLKAGARYLEATEAELNAARAVLVVWTQHSVGSYWVADEAGVGRDSGRLAPISLDGTLPPLGFRQFQVIDFTGWRGGDDGPMGELVAALAAFEPQAAMPVSTPPPPPSSPWRRLALAVLGGLALVAAAWGGLSLLSSRAPIEPPLLAVLAFEAADPGPDAAKFAETLAGELHHTLSQSGADLRLIARASSFSLRDEDRKPADIRAQLKATHILDGTVSRKGDGIVLDVELSDARTGRQVWRTRLTNGLDLMEYTLDDAAKGVREALDLAAGRSAAGGRLDPRAVELYFTALSGPLTPVNMRAAVEALTQAVAIEPGFPRAWQALARAYLFSSLLAEDPSGRAALLEQSRQAAARAVELAPEDAKSWLVASLADQGYEHPEYRERIRQLAPDDPDLLSSDIIARLQSGRAADARTAINRLLEIDPRNGRAPDDAFIATMIAGDLDEAEAMALKFASPESLGLVGVARIQSGDLAGALRVADIFEKRIRLATSMGVQDPGLLRLKEAREIIAALKGPVGARQALADRFVARVEAAPDRNIPETNYVYAFDLPMTAILGGVDRAFDAWSRRLEQLAAPTDADPLANRIEMNAFRNYGYLPGFAALHRDPRFFSALDRFGAHRGMMRWLEGEQWPPDFCVRPGFPYDCTRVARAAFTPPPGPQAEPIPARSTP